MTHLYLNPISYKGGGLRVGIGEEMESDKQELEKSYIQLNLLYGGGSDNEKTVRDHFS